MAIHCVMLLDNNPLLPSSHALCLAVFRLSAMANETSTDPRGALKYVSKIGIERIAAYEHQLLIYVGSLLKWTHGLHLIRTAKDKTSVLFFVQPDFKAAEVGTSLNTKKQYSGRRPSPAAAY
jgi:selenocysteine lyase/cysteine desulfurase